MLLSLSALATLLPSASTNWLARGMGDAVLQAETNYAVPRDLSTLRLGLIGVGTIAIYLVAKWRPARDAAMRMKEITPQIESATSADEGRSRGAA